MAVVEKGMKEEVQNCEEWGFRRTERGEREGGRVKKWGQRVRAIDVTDLSVCVWF